MTTHRSIRELLTLDAPALTPAEAKIAQVLLADYPVAGLGTATALARRAGVSDPSVIRLVSKLGFEGFAAFQRQLLDEVEAGLRSPLMMMQTKRPAAAADGSIEQTYIQSAAATVAAAATMALPQDYARAVRLIMSSKGRVLLLGGRFSRHVAGMLGGYLMQFRADVLTLPALSAETFDVLLDAGPRDVLVVFDYRRYQTDVLRFAEQAADRRVPIVLFTDLWHSPIARRAKVVIAGPAEVDSPYDSIAPAVAQMEALVARLVAEESQARSNRIETLERIRAQNAATVDATSPPSTSKPASKRSSRSSR